MCGIIGLLAKTDGLRGRLGELVTPMLDSMGTRGPDSAGMAVFHEPLADGRRRFGLFSVDPAFDWHGLHVDFQKETEHEGLLDSIESHASLLSDIPVDHFKSWLHAEWPSVHLLSVGRAISVYKDEGHPADIARQLGFTRLTGTHVVAHTRMATESAVSPAHAHPFTAGEDFCLVHNGSLSNAHSVRRKLERLGVAFETDNDTEAGCRFLAWRLSVGDTLEEAIETSFSELDGFFTFLMATADKLVLVRDAFGCKPAVAAETDDYVAVASEYRSLAGLPDIKAADVFEPVPEQVYSWTV